MHNTRQRLPQVVAERPTCVCVSPHMHMCALAVRHKQVELLQALVDVNQCKADAHSDQPVIRGAELAEGPLQVQQDAGCWECRVVVQGAGQGGGVGGDAQGAVRQLKRQWQPCSAPTAVIDQSTRRVFASSAVVAEWQDGAHSLLACHPFYTADGSLCPVC